MFGMATGRCWTHLRQSTRGVAWANRGVVHGRGRAKSQVEILDEIGKFRFKMDGMQDLVFNLGYVS